MQKQEYAGIRAKDETADSEVQIQDEALQNIKRRSIDAARHAAKRRSMEQFIGEANNEGRTACWVRSRLSGGREATNELIIEISFAQGSLTYKRQYVGTEFASVKLALDPRIPHARAAQATKALAWAIAKRWRTTTWWKIDPEQRTAEVVVLRWEIDASGERLGPGITWVSTLCKEPYRKRRTTTHAMAEQALKALRRGQAPPAGNKQCAQEPRRRDPGPLSALRPKRGSYDTGIAKAPHPERAWTQLDSFERTEAMDQWWEAGTSARQLGARQWTGLGRWMIKDAEIAPAGWTVHPLTEQIWTSDNARIRALAKILRRLPGAGARCYARHAGDSTGMRFSFFEPGIKEAPNGGRITGIAGLAALLWGCVGEPRWRPIGARAALRMSTDAYRDLMYLPKLHLESSKWQALFQTIGPMTAAALLEEVAQNNGTCVHKAWLRVLSEHNLIERQGQNRWTMTQAAQARARHAKEAMIGQEMQQRKMAATNATRATLEHELQQEYELIADRYAIDGSPGFFEVAP